MTSKADQALLRSLEIAQRRIQGETSPSIASWLQSEGLSVSGDQLRVYWWRRYGTTPPSAIVAEAEAAISDERKNAMAEEIASLKQQVAELDQLVIDLVSKLTGAENNPEEDATSSMQVDDLTAKCLRLEYDNADLNSRLAWADKERQRWQDMHAQLMRELDTVRLETQAQLEPLNNQLQTVRRTVRERKDFCRELAADHKAKRSSDVKSRLDYLVRWAAKRKGTAQ